MSMLRRIIKPMLQSGFSLMELFFVLAVVCIMLTASVMYFSSLSRSQQITDALQEVEAIIKAGGEYAIANAGYTGFDTEWMQKTKLIQGKYNQIFKASTGEDVLLVPWSDSVSGTAGVAVLPVTQADLPPSLSGWGDFAPQQFFKIRFVDVPEWVCTTLTQQMTIIATPKDPTACTLGGGDLNEISFIDFIVPKLPE